MTRHQYARLVLRAWCELASYDVRYARRGFGAIVDELRTQGVTGVATNGTERGVASAVLLASCFYWKPVLCLQQSVCVVRLLRRRGVAARLTIGYRPVPFLSHAWVEVDGRVINDLPAYQTRLRVLYTA
jgi:hypothetical protein